MFDLKIGFKCNNNCVHCVVADKRPSGNLDIPHIVKIIESVPQGEIIQITGGEPTIFSFLPSILKICKEQQHPTCIQTNGTGFSDKDFFEECKPFIDHVHIAIHSCDPQVHDGIVGSEGMWEKTIQGWNNVITANIKCSTQTVLSRYNISTLYDTFTFIQNRLPGVRMSMTYPHMLGNAWANREDVAFRYSEYKEEIQKTLKEFRDHTFTEAIPPCYLYPNFPKESDIKDFLNGTTRKGVDFSGGFGERNYNILDIRSKRKGPKCRECKFCNQCIGVWKEYIDQFKNCLDLYPIKDDKCY